MRSRIAKEAVVENKTKRSLRLSGSFVLKLNVQGRRGFPDVLVIEPDGGMRFIEFKRKGGKLSKLQEVTIRELTRRGVRVDVIYGI